ncbi:MAG: zf-HC2 domain-containing protein [Thermoanaerobacteraceae bacterium]|nr:zf-HC2 domain-containing protein [Thermoanaerobacteraceae bacterium]
MNCREVRENLPLYVDGTVNEEKALEIERHLIECEECQIELDKYIRIREALKSFEELSLPDEYNERLKEKLDKATKARPPFMKYIAVAATVVVIFSGIRLISSNGVKDDRIAQSIESAVPEAPKTENTTAGQPQAEPSTSQYAKNKEERGNEDVGTNGSVQSAMPDEAVQRDEASEDKAADVSGENNSMITAESAEKAGNENSTPQTSYGIVAAKRMQPLEDNDAAIEEIMKKYNAEILERIVENNRTVITVQVDKSKEKEFMKEFASIADKIEKTDDGNLKIFLKGDKNE